LLAWALLACAGGWLAPAAAQDPAAAPALRVEAAPADWSSQQPPAQGWTPVQLPDLWTRRWPAHDGVTWYRLRWNEPADRPVAPRGLRLDSASLAAAFYLNGQEIGRDVRLVEPLSRSWNQPRYWRLDAPLLRPGANELWIRVSGFAAFQPGLGRVWLGPPQALRADFEQRELWSRSVHWVGLGLSLAMAVVFGMLWLLRSSETSYGWFSLFTLAWMLYVYNNVARSPWPFATTASYQAFVQLLLVATVGGFGMFALELRGRAGRGPRRLLATALGLAVLLALAPPPPWHAAARSLVVLLCLLVFVCGCALIVREAWRTRQVDLVVLACSLLLPLLAGVHDTLLFMALIPGANYYSAPAAMGTLLGSSFALTWRMVQGMRLIEHFNAELQARVADARQQLADHLADQHAAALVQTRLTERMNMVRDLHDGLGMTLSSHLQTLRNGPAVDLATRSALAALQEISDDLRLIIETSSFENSDALAERLAPLRHRATRLLEASGIDVAWRLDGLESCLLPSQRALDVLRVLQEALANVLKHSRASRARVTMVADASELRLTVTDDGAGIAEAALAEARGIGMQSMRTRAARLQGTLEIRSDADGTCVELRCPVQPQLPGSLPGEAPRDDVARAAGGVPASFGA
jgi:signal transduction histidine kinase